MKIAIVSDDNQTISQHFGRAENYIVISLEHENIKDCDILVTRGMGRGAYLDLQHLGIKPIVTDIADFETAIQAVLNETIIDHVEKLH